MYIPKKMLIRGANWVIKVEKDPRIGDHVVAGYCWTDKNTIAVEKTLSPAMMLETFVHEYLHALLTETGVHDEDFPKWLEHWIVTAIAKDMRNNASLFAKVFSSSVSL